MFTIFLLKSDLVQQTQIDYFCSASKITGKNGMHDAISTSHAVQITLTNYGKHAFSEKNRKLS